MEEKIEFLKKRDEDVHRFLKTIEEYEHKEAGFFYQLKHTSIFRSAYLFGIAITITVIPMCIYYFVDKSYRSDISSLLKEGEYYRSAVFELRQMVREHYPSEVLIETINNILKK